MKKILFSLVFTAIFGISVTINSLDLSDNSIKTKDDISEINDEEFTSPENEYILQEINIESSSEI
tara:strand:+ start:5756 stop:5950 length:195 start_codon:yes stop_codon:yes gene_type:complete